MGARQYKLIERWVDAIHYTGFNQAEIEQFVGYKMAGKTPSSNVLIIKNPSGESSLSPGQWIVRGREVAYEPKRRTSFFSMDNGPFTQTYDTRDMFSKEAEDEEEVVMSEADRKSAQKIGGLLKDGRPMNEDAMEIVVSLLKVNKEE